MWAVPLISIGLKICLKSSTGLSAVLDKDLSTFKYATKQTYETDHVFEKYDFEASSLTQTPCRCYIKKKLLAFSFEEWNPLLVHKGWVGEVWLSWWGETIPSLQPTDWSPGYRSLHTNYLECYDYSSHIIMDPMAPPGTSSSPLPSQPLCSFMLWGQAPLHDCCAHGCPAALMKGLSAVEDCTLSFHTVGEFPPKGKEMEIACLLLSNIVRKIKYVVSVWKLANFLLFLYHLTSI